MLLGGSARAVDARAHDSFYTAREVGMAIPLSTMKDLQDKCVRMRFDDGHECIATLLSASQDLDGSLHLIYDKVEWANDPCKLDNLKNKTLYSEGETLVSIEEVPPVVAGF
jgi:hypothetical protein